MAKKFRVYYRKLYTRGSPSVIEIVDEKKLIDLINESVKGNVKFISQNPIEVIEDE